MTGLRVLVVDDEPFIRTTVSTLLRLEGYVVDMASDGRAGLQAALARPPDVILTDLNMPWLSGHGLLAAVRADANLAHAAVVFLTGDVPAGALPAGEEPDARLTKPFTRHQLLSVLLSVHAKRGKVDHRASPATPENPPQA